MRMHTTDEHGGDALVEDAANPELVDNIIRVGRFRERVIASLRLALESGDLDGAIELARSLTGVKKP